MTDLGDGGTRVGRSNAHNEDAALGPPPIPLAKVTEILRRNTLYIAFHEPVITTDGRVENLKMLWWNENYASIRATAPSLGTFASETYINPDEVMDLATTAWRVGMVRQNFQIDAEATSIYLLPGRPTALAVMWIAYADLIVEIAEDLTQQSNTQAELEIRRLELAEVQHHQQISRLRERLASNMHDRLIQHLFAIGIGIESVLSEVPESSGRQLRSCQSQLQSTIDEVRQMVQDLSSDPSVDPAEIQRRKLSSEVEGMAMALGFSPTFHSNLNETLPAGLRYDITAVIRESLANAARHSGASEVTVTVDRSHERLTVVTHDNGRGFVDTEQTTTSTSQGLRNMAKRAEQYRGNLILRSRPSETEVIWTVPLSPS
jgi:signal transduction histidine kinase